MTPLVNRGFLIKMFTRADLYNPLVIVLKLPETNRYPVWNKFGWCLFIFKLWNNLKNS